MVLIRMLAKKVCEGIKRKLITMHDINCVRWCLSINILSRGTFFDIEISNTLPVLDNLHIARQHYLQAWHQHMKMHTRCRVLLVFGQHQMVNMST